MVMLRGTQFLGNRFGRLAVIARVPKGKYGETRWQCRCVIAGTIRLWLALPFN